MAKVVVLNLPEYGHMNATYPLIAELVRRGEQVTYYATEAFRASIEQTGANFASYGDVDRFTPPAHTGGLHSVMAWEIELAEQLLPQLVQEVRDAHPDYLLIDSMCVWGNLLRQVLALPAIAMASVFVPNDEHVSVEDLIQAAYGSAPKEVLLAGIDAMNSYIECSRRIDRRFGTVSPNLVEFFSNRQALNLLFTSREFHPGGEHFDDSYRFVGPMFNSLRIEPDADEILPLRRDLPLIYISLGTIYNDRPDFYRACIEAYGDGPFSVLIATGNKVDPASLGKIPENILLRERVPQLDVLRQASLFVTHGGMNSASEALASGVPLLIFPQHGDQHLVAGRVVEIGAGLRISPLDMGPNRLRALTETVLHTPSFAASAREIAVQFARCGGAQAAADAVMEFSNRLHAEKVSCQVG